MENLNKKITDAHFFYKGESYSLNGDIEETFQKFDMLLGFQKDEIIRDKEGLLGHLDLLLIKSQKQGELSVGEGTTWIMIIYQLSKSGLIEEDNGNGVKLVYSKNAA